MQNIRIKILIVLLFLSFGCTERNSSKTRIIDTDVFTIEVPINWKYRKEQGTDSFVGRITGRGLNLEFDAGGYTSHIMLSEQEYINNSRNWLPDMPYHEEGVIYTSGGVEGTRKMIMEKEGITDTSLVIVKKFPIALKDTIYLQNGEYKAIIEYADTVIYKNVKIPDEIKNHNILIDTIDNYIRKIITPKNGLIGITGIYLKKIQSNFALGIMDENLSLENQKKAVKAFKSIKFKE